MSIYATSQKQKYKHKINPTKKIIIGISFLQNSLNARNDSNTENAMN